jgi:hypothetical protein
MQSTKVRLLAVVQGDGGIAIRKQTNKMAQVVQHVAWLNHRDGGPKLGRTGGIGAFLGIEGRLCARAKMRDGKGVPVGSFGTQRRAQTGGGRRMWEVIWHRRTGICGGMSKDFEARGGGERFRTCRE